MDLTGKKILVTGGKGFLGQALCKRLCETNGIKIFCSSRKCYDLRFLENAESLVNNSFGFHELPDIIFHLAASVGGIGANQMHPGSFFYDNMIMGMNIMECARLYNINKVVMVGSICAYPKFAPIPFKEKDLWNGYPEETNAPYGIAKKSLLVMAQGYRKEYGLNIVTVFPVNLYGPNDNFDLTTSHVIPAMIRKFIKARRENENNVVLWGDGSATREFLYVDDAAEALVLTAQKYDSSEPMNIGAGFEISIKELAEIIKDMTDYKGKIVWDTSKPNGQPRRMLDVSKAREEIGFEAKTSFEEGLKKAIDWYYCNNF